MLKLPVKDLVLVKAFRIIWLESEQGPPLFVLKMEMSLQSLILEFLWVILWLMMLLEQGHLGFKM